jgi:hypothetical protein
MELFEQCDAEFWKKSPFALYNSTVELAQCKQGLWKAKANSEYNHNN